MALCRKHLLFRQRHGSPICASPAAWVLKPFILSAEKSIRTSRDDAFIHAALNDLRCLMDAAGPVILSSRLKGLSAKQRADVVLARLRERSIAPNRLLALVLSVHALMRDRPELCHRIKEWRIVAVAKAAHRLAGGDHKVWELRENSGRLLGRTELHTYPRSAGRVLRFLGEAIEKPCEWVIEKNLQNVIVRLSKPQ